MVFDHGAAIALAAPALYIDNRAARLRVDGSI